jgi:hypothetical protein
MRTFVAMSRQAAERHLRDLVGEAVAELNNGTFIKHR